jgi:hypothetical protein
MRFITCLALLLVVLPLRADTGKTVYVMIGLESPSKYTVGDARRAAEKYKALGYNVILNLGATKSQLVRAVNDPDTRAIWFCGHGYKDDDGNWDEAISAVERTVGGETEVTSAEITPPANNCIEELVLHSCGQNLDSWKQKFSHAKFYGWSTYTTPLAIRYWEYYVHTITAPGVTPPDNLPPPPLDPRVRPNDFPIIIKPSGRMEVGVDIFTVWRINDTLLADYGLHRTFNFYLTGGGLPEPQWLFSGDITYGYLSADFEGPFGAPGYDIIMPYEKFAEFYTNRDRWSDLFTGGFATVNVYDTDLDPLTAYRGTGSALLGLEGALLVPEPTQALPVGILLLAAWRFMRSRRPRRASGLSAREYRKV